MITDAERAIIRYIQSQHFSEVILAINQNEQSKVMKMTKRNSKLSKLDPFIEDGILRVGGRLDRALMSYDAKHPIILPKDSPVSTMIIQIAYKIQGHLGRSTVLNSVRQRFWIIGANSLVKRITSKCVLCRRYQSKPMEQKNG
jgi:hypothetical protein